LNGQDLEMKVVGNGSPYRHPNPDWLLTSSYYSVGALPCVGMWFVMVLRATL